jgi:N-formylglutamate amidohydrolase
MPDRERASILQHFSPPFRVFDPPEQTAPFVLCSPHSGRVYPASFLAQSRLDPRTLRKSEDGYVDALFQHVARIGAPLIAAEFPRAYLDLNREPYELDPELFAEPLPDYANTQSVRVVGGLGTIARIVADGEEIYAAPIALAAALERIEQLYKPFHQALAELLEATRQRFGYAILIDCHSMPSTTTATGGAPRPDFVIGDRFGASCDSRLTRFMREVLTGLGYDVQLNRPYAGGFITEHYGRPSRQMHAVQLEINRGLYLDEATMLPTAGFVELERHLSVLTTRLFKTFPVLVERRAAAE